MYYSRQEIARVPLLEATTRQQAYRTKTAGTQVTVFLSHSHKDASIVEQAVQILGSQGVTIYVDWKDQSMPAVTSPSTAVGLKLRIRECKKFVLLATDNALQSRWCPWELGIGDAYRGMDSVAILPVTDPPHAWSGSEYVGIYSRIEKSDTGIPAVFEPGKNSGVTLAQWLTT